MSAALLIRERNPDANFVLHGGPPLYTERTSFYPTNSDITTTTKDLTQHKYRAELYRDILLEDDDNLRGSLRSAARSLRLVSNNIRQNLEEDGTAKTYLPQSQSQHGKLTYRDQMGLEEDTSAAKTYLTQSQSLPRSRHGGGLTYRDELDLTEKQAGSRGTRREDQRKWLTDSEWNTSSGHHVAYEGNVPRATLVSRGPSMTSGQPLTKSLSQEREAERLWRTVNVDMDLAEVPLTRFTRKDLMASEYFPVTMSSCSASEGSTSPRRSRSRSSSHHRLAKSAVVRSGSPGRTPVTDNFRNMKRLEKLYLVTSEVPATGNISDLPKEGYGVLQILRDIVDILRQMVPPTAASAPHAIVSPYLDEIAQLRRERLRLEEEHLKELNRLTTLERVRGPKPKWYELKDTQFHFEAGKNNELLRSHDRWNTALKYRSFELSQSQPDLSALHMRSASFS
ncbi:hypothetical protein ACOMHN_060834 [Nucella lapillus]